MSFSNLQYLYDHLPARYRREDTDLFLKRFLQFYGDTLDDWDEAFDAFYGDIASGTAAEKWVRFWLLALFGWSWFPWWFTLLDMRRLYGNFAGHLARRGTRPGIERWLREFGIVARVHTRVAPYGEFVWGETTFAVTQPLHMIVEIIQVEQSPYDISYWGEGAWGEAFYSDPPPAFSEREIVDLIRFMQPHAQVIDVVWRLAQEWPTDEIYWEQISW